MCLQITLQLKETGGFECCRQSIDYIQAVHEESGLYLSLPLPCCFIMVEPSVFTAALGSSSLGKHRFLWRALQDFTVFMLRFHNQPVFTDAGVNIQPGTKEIQQSWDRNDTESEDRTQIRHATVGLVLKTLLVRACYSPSRCVDLTSHFTCVTGSSSVSCVFKTVAALSAPSSLRAIFSS